MAAAAIVAAGLGLGVAAPAGAATTGAATTVHRQAEYAAPGANSPMKAAGGHVSAAATAGYDLVGSDGGVFVFPVTGGSFFGSLPGDHVSVGDVVGMVASADERGYFLVGSDGGVFSFGDTHYEGSLPGIGVVPSQPIVGIVPSSDDKGYFLVGADGGVFTFGDAAYEGSLPGSGISDTAVSIAATPDNKGYWVLGSGGTVYAFGTANAHYGGLEINNPCSGVPDCTALPPPPLVSITAKKDGMGYWITEADGHVFAFGDAGQFGDASGSGVSDIVSLVPTADDQGYWLIGRDGAVMAYGDATNEGSLPALGINVNHDIVGAVPTA